MKSMTFSGVPAAERNATLQTFIEVGSTPASRHVMRVGFHPSGWEDTQHEIRRRVGLGRLRYGSPSSAFGVVRP